MQNVPYQTPYTPQAPYQAPPSASRFAPTDQSMTALAMVGLALTVFTCLPIGIFTGPMALSRASAATERVAQGLHPETHLNDIRNTRICAWIGIALSLPFVLAVLGLIAILVAAGVS